MPWIAHLVSKEVYMDPTDLGPGTLTWLGGTHRVVRGLSMAAQMAVQRWQTARWTMQTLP